MVHLAHKSLTSRLGAAIFIVALSFVFRAEASGTNERRAERIVSLNLCTDQLLIDLVEKARIAALTELATDSLSTPVPERAAGLPVTTSDAEAVLMRRPDLVLASIFSPPATLEMLRRSGIAVETVTAPHTLAEVRRSILALSAKLGAEARGAALAATLDAAEARAREAASRTARQPSALLLQPNNYVAGSASLASDLLRVAGFRNHADALGVGAFGQVSLEQLVASPPDVLILASDADDYLGAAADNLRHPALAALGQRVSNAVIPWSEWLCGTHHVARVLDRLAMVRAKLPRDGRQR